MNAGILFDGKRASKNMCLGKLYCPEHIGVLINQSYLMLRYLGLDIIVSPCLLFFYGDSSSWVLVLPFYLT